MNSSFQARSLALLAAGVVMGPLLFASAEASFVVQLVAVVAVASLVAGVVFHLVKHVS